MSGSANVGQYKRLTSNNVGLVQMSDWYKWLVWMSDSANVGQYKRPTCTNVGLVQMLDWYKCQTVPTSDQN